MFFEINFLALLNPTYVQTAVSLVGNMLDSVNNQKESLDTDEQSKVVQLADMIEDLSKNLAKALPPGGDVIIKTDSMHLLVTKSKLFQIL